MPGAEPQLQPLGERVAAPVRGRRPTSTPARRRAPGRRTAPGAAAARHMIVMPPMEWPPRTTGPVGASWSSSVAQVVAELVDARARRRRRRTGPRWSGRGRAGRSGPGAARRRRSAVASRSATSSHAAWASVHPWARTTVAGGVVAARRRWRAAARRRGCGRRRRAGRWSGRSRGHLRGAGRLGGGSADVVLAVELAGELAEPEREVRPQRRVVAVLVEVPAGAAAGEPDGALRLLGDQVAVGLLRLRRSSPAPRGPRRPWSAGRRRRRPPATRSCRPSTCARRRRWARPAGTGSGSRPRCCCGC